MNHSPEERFLSIAFGSMDRFLGWAGRKIRIHAHRKEVHFHEREIWWVSLGHNVGSEENGKHDNFERPVLILKKITDKLFFGIPLTTREKEGSWYHPFVFDGVKRSAILSQLRTLSGRRLIRPMGRMDVETFRLLKQAMIDFIQTNPPDEAEGFSGSLFTGSNVSKG